MTDNEIKKALECCVSTDDCKKCPLGGTHQCYPTLEKNALDLINRQQAEIEKWKAEYTRACAERDARICTQDYFKAEAIKEFAERLKAKVDPNWDNSVDVEDIDRLVAEMTGEQNA